MNINPDSGLRQNPLGGQNTGASLLPCDDSGYEVEFDFSDYAPPGSPICDDPRELEEARKRVDAWIQNLVTQLRRGERSIIPAIPRKDGACHSRRHLKGAVAEVYGYGFNLSKNDPEDFFWSGFENLQKKSRKRVRLRGENERRIRRKPIHVRARTPESYGKRQIRYAVKALVADGLFVPAVRVRHGIKRRGWIVKPHDEWATLVTYGDHTYCLTGPLGTVGKFFEQVRVGRLDIPGLMSILRREIGLQSGQSAYAKCTSARTQSALKVSPKCTPERTQSALPPPPNFLDSQELKDSGKIGAAGSHGQPLNENREQMRATHAPTSKDPEADKSPTLIQETQETESRADLLANSADPKNPKILTVGEAININTRLEEPITGYLFAHPHQLHYDRGKRGEDAEAFITACIDTINAHAAEPFLGIETCERLTAEVMDRLQAKQVKAPKGWYPILKTLREFSKGPNAKMFADYFMWKRFGNDVITSNAVWDNAMDCEFELGDLLKKNLRKSGSSN
jgi:hypothetical protein